MVLLILSTGSLLQSYPVRASSPYTVHPPIQIVGNSGFTMQNGVVGGSGTPSDPYMIEGWSIVAPYGQAAIRIENTTAFFLIRHVQLLNALPGIYLRGVTNGSTKNSTLANSNVGIRIESSTNITIAGNNISGSYGGVYTADILSSLQTTGLTIVNNTFSGAGVVADSSKSLASRLNITRNTFLLTGVETTAYGAIVDGNNVTGSVNSPAGLTIEGNSSLVSDNSITGGGIRVVGSGTTIKNNRVDTISLDTATQITLRDNLMTGGVLFSNRPPLDTPPFYDSHIMTGNTVNGKPVVYFARCSGTNIDGTTAGEMILASCTNVRVANLQPSNAEEGIVMVYVHQGSVMRNNLFASTYRGIDILHSSGLQISGNNFNGTQASISDTDNVTVTSNLAVGGVYPAWTISRTRNILVSNNTLERGTTAFNLADVTNATLVGNWISDNGSAVAVLAANGLNITANNIVRDPGGLTLDNFGTPNGIFNTVIYHNNFVDSGAYYRFRVQGTFDNGYPSGGNYWSNYRGVDNCKGPLQNICSGPDGIGDKPITIGNLTGAPGTLLDRYPLVNPYGNFSWDRAAPTWPIGSGLSVSSVNSTSLTLKWTRAVDEAWVNSYRIYEDGALLVTLPRDVQNFTITNLNPGSMHRFKIEAGDPGRNWSTDGPSATATLAQQTSLFSISWWIEHWYIGILVAGLLGLAATGIILIRRRNTRTTPK